MAVGTVGPMRVYFMLQLDGRGKQSMPFQHCSQFSSRGSRSDLRSRLGPRAARRVATLRASRSLATRWHAWQRERASRLDVVRDSVALELIAFIVCHPALLSPQSLAW